MKGLTNIQICNYDYIKKISYGKRKKGEKVAEDHITETTRCR